ncbi:MAG TPA: hypothetical protein VFQ00_10980 [Terriglobales bacterium]|nr:hypothetical protein [Terriglobales bacterium]
MPKRLVTFVAVVLVVLVFFVCVMPQVDLDYGVLRDCQWQILLLAFLTLSLSLVIQLSAPLFRVFHSFVSDAAPPSAMFACQTSVLRL